MEPITPYLNFNGNAAEALDFYSKAFDGRVVSCQTYGASPMEAAPGWADKILHAIFEAGSLSFMVSDISHAGDRGVTAGTNTQLALNFKHAEDMERVFAAMSEGAEISMPLQDTFWGARFGMLKDRFGISWMFNYDKPKEP